MRGRGVRNSFCMPDAIHLGYFIDLIRHINNCHLNEHITKINVPICGSVYKLIVDLEGEEKKSSLLCERVKGEYTQREYAQRKRIIKTYLLHLNFIK